MGAGEIRGCIFKLTSLRRKQRGGGSELVVSGEGGSSLEKVRLGWERQKDLDIQDVTLPFLHSQESMTAKLRLFNLILYKQCGATVG